MEFEEFEAQIESFRAEQAARSDPDDEDDDDFRLFDAWTATDDDLAAMEAELGMQLPSKYKRFMRVFGGGGFASLELLPARSPDGRSEDLLSVNTGEFAMPNFVQVAPVGTGDYWGFVSENGVCHEQVSFLYHDEDRVDFAFDDFYEFALAKGRIWP